MKRTGNLFEKIIDIDNLALAGWKAFRGMGHKQAVINFRKDFCGNLYKLRNDLIYGRVRYSYNRFDIYEPKHRVICAADLWQRIIHHAIMNVCHDYFDKNLIYDCYASRPGKGVLAAVKRTKAKMAGYDFYVKLDVKKFFDSVDHGILMAQLSDMFKDKMLMKLLYNIISSYSTILGKGIPIGNLTSQYFANLYLSELDHYMKEKNACAILCQIHG